MSEVNAFLARRPMAGDAAWALVLAPFLVATPVVMGIGPPVGFVLIVSVVLALLWRRTHPSLLAGVTVLAHLVQLATTDAPGPLQIVVPVTLYAAAAYEPRRERYAWLGIAVLGSFAAALDWLRQDRGNGPLDTLVVHVFITGSCLAVVAASWIAGELGRQRRLSVEALRDRAEALERERDQRAQLAAQEERARIAREMHDVVAHNLSVIVVLADGAAYAATRGSSGDASQRVGAAASALGTIGETARTALAETRRLVGVLRTGEGGADYTPQATLAQIGELTQRLGAAGVPTSYDVVGDAATHPPLGAGAELAAYRVVQESLTNVVKHAGPGVRVHVTLEHRPDGLGVAVRDDGSGSGGAYAARGDEGHGLIGMRERVATYGGSLVARDRMAGGFEVLAWLPAGPPGPQGAS